MKKFRVWYYLGDSCELSSHVVEAESVEKAIYNDFFESMDILIDRVEEV